MKKDKKLNKTLLYSFFAIILVAALILSLVRNSKNDSNKVIIKKEPAKDLVVQSYKANKTPSLKDDDHLFGLKDSALKIFVFEDYTSPYSASLADTLDRIKVEAGDKVSVIVRPFFSNSLESSAAARAISCAGQEGKWKEMRALLFIKAKNKQAVPSDWLPIIGQLKLSQNNFLTCLTNQKKSGTIEQQVGEAKIYGVIGSPTIFIGDEMVVGARPYDDYVDSNGDKIEGLKSLIARKIS